MHRFVSDTFCSSLIKRYSLSNYFILLDTGEYYKIPYRVIIKVTLPFVIDFQGYFTNKFQIQFSFFHFFNLY